MPIVIKMMLDYYSYPLWCVAPGEYRNLNPEELPLSNALKENLMALSNTYDKTLNNEDPIASGFHDEKKEAEFENKKRLLAQELQKELGSAYLVTQG